MSLTNRIYRFLPGFVLTLALCNAAARSSSAQYILPGTGNGATLSGITVSKPSNTSAANASRTGLTADSAFVDDVFLTSMMFGNTTFNSGNGQFRAVGNVNVVSGANNVNAEYGDADTNSDGNPDPFTLGGVSNANPESTDPAIQRPSIRAAFNSMSLVQGIDGEGSPYVLDMIFQRGINDNNAAAVDSTPELVFFERGVNSTYQVQAIIGGTFLNPIFATNMITINSGSTSGAGAQSRATGLYIDTVEIGGGQQLGVTGLDLSSFFNGAASTVYGVRITDTNGSDLYGNFMSAADTSQFVEVPDALKGDGFLSETVSTSGSTGTAVPEAGTGTLMLLPLLSAGYFAVARARSRKA